MSEFLRRIKRNRNPAYEERAHSLAREILKLEEEIKALRRKRGIVEPDESEQYDPTDFPEVHASEMN